MTIFCDEPTRWPLPRKFPTQSPIYDWYCPLMMQRHPIIHTHWVQLNKFVVFKEKKQLNLCDHIKYENHSAAIPIVCPSVCYNSLAIGHCFSASSGTCRLLH